jgi:uncharacterized protein DUF6456
MAKHQRKPVAVGIGVPACQLVTIAGRPPIAERAQWDDPDDRNIRSKTARQVIGHRRVDPLVTIHRREGLVTESHLRAAVRYRDDYETGIEGATPPKDEGQSSAGPGAGMDARLDAMARFRQATQAVGQRLSRILVAIVLGLEDVTRYAASVRINRHIAMGYLIAALDRLAEFYEPAPV